MPPNPVLWTSNIASAAQADWFNALVATVDNFAAARNFIGEPGMRLYISGASTPSDGGGGMFSWTVGPAVDDNLNTIVATNAFPTAYWSRVNASASAGTLGYVNIFQYLTTSQITAVQNGTSTQDFSPILATAINSATYNGIPAFGIASGPLIYFPPGLYNFLSTVNIKQTVVIAGAGGGGLGGFKATILSWPTNTMGLIVNRSNTFGSSTVASTTGADGTVIRDLAIISRGGTDNTQHGVWMRARASLENVSIGGFPGNQCNIVATQGSGGATEGNANGWMISKCSFTAGSGWWDFNNYGVNGLNIEGGDTNAGGSYNLNLSGFAGWGIRDNSFLGCTHTQPESAGCGTQSYVNYLGTSYVANPTTTSTLLGSTTPGTDGTVWVATTSTPSAPTWILGILRYPGGDYAALNINGHTIFVGAYSEGNSPQGYLAGRSMAVQVTNVNSWTGPGTVMSAASNATLYNWSVGTLSVNGSETVTAAVQSGGTILSYNTTTNFPNTWRLVQSGKDILETYANLSTNLYNVRTGPLTTFTFGRSATQPYVTWLPNLFVPGQAGNLANSRGIFTTTASPTSTGNAVGELALNRTPTTTTPLCWSLTTQGSPDTWIPNYTLDSLTVTASGLTMSTARLLGRSTAATGAVEEITVGSGLTLSGGTLSASGGGTVTSVALSGGTTGITVSGSPITTSGTITLAGTLAIANGGTGQTSAAAALSALGGIGISASTLNTPGYIKLSNGLFLMWGSKATSGSGDLVVSYNTELGITTGIATFSNAVISGGNTTDTTTNYPYVSATSITGFTVHSVSGTASTFFWFAVGA